MMAISKEEVAHVASLAKLSIEEAQLDEVTGQLSEIIGMVEQLESVDTNDVPVTTHVQDLVNVMREDKAVAVDERAALLANAPDTEGNYIRVPVIIDEGEDA